MPFAGTVRVQSFESITEVSFYTPDHPRLLSLIAGACTMCEASIIGRADFFDARRPRARHLPPRRAFTSDEDEKVRAHRIIDTVRELLQGEKYIPSDLGKDSRLNRRLKPFSVPGQVIVSNALSRKFTVIEVSGARPHRSAARSDQRHFRSEPDHRLRPYRHLWRKGGGRVLCHRPVRAQDRGQEPRQKKIHDRLMAVLEPKREKQDRQDRQAMRQAQ